MTSRFPRRPALAALPDLGLGAAYLVAWLLPGFVGVTAVSWLTLVIVLEAPALLAAYLIAMVILALTDRDASLGVRAAAVGLILLLVAVAAAEVLRYRFWWPVVVLAGLLVNRLGGLLSDRLSGDDAKRETLLDALWTLALYAVAIAPTFYFAVPTFGAGAPALPPEHARWCAMPADLVYEFFEAELAGNWCDEPHRALAGGALYFFASAFRGLRRARRER